MWPKLRGITLVIKVDGFEIFPYSKSRWPVSWWSPAYMGSPFLSRPISICFIERSGGFSSSLDFSDSSFCGCVVTKNTSLDGGYHDRRGPRTLTNLSQKQCLVGRNRCIFLLEYFCPYLFRCYFQRKMNFRKDLNVKRFNYLNHQEFCKVTKKVL